MKNISVALNAVLVIAVAILYYLHFKKPSEEIQKSNATMSLPVSGISPTIVFVNTDSLLDNYSLYKTKKAEFESKRDKAESELKAESDKLQNDAAQYQQKASMMADAERQKTEEQLMSRQQNLMKKKDDILEKLDNEQSKFSDELHAKIVSFAKEFNENKNYSYILAYQKGSAILLANDSLDVTKQILEGLNKEKPGEIISRQSMEKAKIFTRTILILSLVSLFNDISSEMLLPILPIYLSSIGFTALYIGILEGFAEAVVGLTKGYFGQRSDETDNRVSFVRGGYSLSAISKPMMALLVFPFWIFISRTLDRLGKGIRTNARDALLADESSNENRGKVFGFHRAMDTVGAAIGPALALIYLFFFPRHYRNVFLIAFVPSAIAVGLTFVLKQRQNLRKKESKPFRFFSYFGYWKDASAQYKKVIPTFLLFALFNSSDAFLILIGKHNGLQDTTIILAYIFFNIVYAAFSFPMGKLADKYGMKFSYSIGLVGFIAAYALMPFASTTILFFTAFFIYGIYAACNDGISKAWITTICPSEAKGTALGFYTSFQSIVALASSSLAGLLWMKINPSSVFFISAGGTFFVLLYVLFFLKERRELSSEVIT